MAQTTLKRAQHFGLSENPVRDLIIQLNKLVDDVELIRLWAVAVTAKLDLDAGVTDTNYAAAATLVAIDAASKMTVAKIGNEAGTAISA